MHFLGLRIYFEVGGQGMMDAHSRKKDPSWNLQGQAEFSEGV